MFLLMSNVSNIPDPTQVLFRESYDSFVPHIIKDFKFVKYSIPSNDFMLSAYISIFSTFIASVFEIIPS